ncbi:transposase [Pontibacter sp. MBLB2868]|uniref:transposase n=1 Tax=Pontibacter sp. MBLB2868 TaxID=3451555 RepID=UPI003F74FE6E
MKRPDRKRNRLNGYDYSREGLYFVTSCVLDKACVFGQVANEEMIVSTYGQIAERQWHWLAEQYPYLVLHTFVVMPNHVHGILEIDWAEIAPETKVKSISELMGAYKATTSKQIRLAGLTDFAWQRSFHYHIIRHQRAYINIMHYIQNNPSLWKEDLFYQEPLTPIVHRYR